MLHPLLLAAAASTALVDADGVIPMWARGGSLFAERVAAADAADARLGILRNSTPNYYEQQVDHTDPSRGTFLQRYFVDSSYATAGGPVFLYIGGEGPAGGTPGGYVAVLAQEHGALLVCVEHRWYGGSMPGLLTDKALFTSTLSVEAAMADLAAFVPFFEATLGGGKRQWLAVGGSYAGALAAWFRETHPELVDAAWSSSGVVEATFDFVAFDQTVVRDVSVPCADALRGITALAEEAWDAGPDERSRLLALFNAPATLSRTDFLWMLADSGAMGAQYGAKEALCAAVLPVGKDPLQQFATWTAARYGPAFAQACYYNTACLSDSANAASWPNQYPWVWQCCSELAYWQPGYKGSIRSQAITLDYFTRQCRAAFYPDTTANTTGFNARFGGFDNTATQVVALSGSDDPWSPACVNASRPTQDYVFALATCDGCGHCGDLHAPGGGDAPSLTAQRAVIASSLKRWLSP